MFYGYNKTNLGYKQEIWPENTADEKTSSNSVG